MKVEISHGCEPKGCEAAPKGLKPKSGEEVVEVSRSAAYRKAGTFTNVAVVEGNHKIRNPTRSKSNWSHQGFEVVKKQRLLGALFVTGRLSGKTPPQTVEYEVVVKDTGKRR